MKEPTQVAGAKARQASTSGEAQDTMVPFIMPTSWVKAALHCGFSIEPLLEEAGLEVALGASPMDWVSVQSVHRLMRLCVDKAAPRFHFPFVLGEEFIFDNLPAFEIFVTTSPTLRDSLRALDWVRQVLPNVGTELREEGRRATLRIDVARLSENTQGHLFLTEVVFASLNKFARLLLGENVSAQAVYFKHRQADRLALYEATFRSPVRLGQKFNGLIFDRAMLDAPLRGALPQVHKQAEVLVSQQVSKNAAKRGFAATVEQQLLQEPALLRLGLEGLADKLKLHPRTLQRRLRDEDDHFALVQSRVRLALARTWLDDGALSVEDISERLGFADRHSFSRAFRRWTGRTPSGYRRHSESLNRSLGQTLVDVDDA